MKANKVLIVEDADDSRAMLELFLDSEGYAVSAAENGLTAWNLLSTTRPDLLLTDVAMPLMDELELTRRMKSCPETAAMPVIVMTAYGGYWMEAARLSGASEVVCKPLDFDELLTVMWRCNPRSH